MKKKALALLMIIPVLVMFLLYGVGGAITLAVPVDCESIILPYDNGEEFLFNDLNESVDLSATPYPLKCRNGEVVWSVISDSEEPRAVIENNKLIILNEGEIRLTAKLKDGSIVKTVSAYLVLKGDLAKYVYVSDSDIATESANEKVYGLYDLTDGKKTPALIKLSIKVYPSTAAAMVKPVNFSDSAIVYDEEKKALSVQSVGSYSVTFGQEGTEITSVFNFSVVDGVNVFNYEQLLSCTNNSASGEVTIMRTNLLGQEALKNMKGELFGRLDASGKVTCDYVERESTYDTKFYANRNQTSPKLKVGIVFKKDVYGNGYTLNAHELTFPSETLTNGKVTYNLSDPFQGPLIFVSAGGLTVYGEDNAGFMLNGDNLTIRDIKLKNCDTQNDLTNYDYVGTVLEIKGNNNKLDFCNVSCGRTVVRSFSNEGLLLNKCTLTNAREFILKLGSDSIVYGGNLCDANERAWRSNVPLFEYARKVDNIAGDNTNAPSDSGCEVKDSYFSRSGVFSIGIDTHFSGPFLFSGLNGRFAEAVGLAATSYATRLKISGDTRFYDWKTIEGLDSSTLVSGANESVAFNISALIKACASGDLSKLIATYRGKEYVHGGIAFFGGGLNLSTVTFDGTHTVSYVSFNLKMNDERLTAIADYNSSLISNSVGFGHFSFYMYDNGNSISPAELLPTLH